MISEQKKAYLKSYNKLHYKKIMARNKSYRESHREERRATDKIYRESHREEESKRKKAYRESHREKVIATEKAYRNSHRKEIKERNVLNRILGTSKTPLICKKIIAIKRAIKNNTLNKTYPLIQQGATHEAYI